MIDNDLRLKEKGNFNNKKLFYITETTTEHKTLNNE